jgi:hypothetical protein
MMLIEKYINLKVVFTKEKELVKKRNHKGLFRFVLDAPLLNILVSPIVYSLIIPFFLFDFWVWFYQFICFPVFKITRINRSEYIILDRGKLKYLNKIEGFNCNFCAYANGVIAYTREVASLTEQYFCPIKHQQSKVLSPHPRYNNFLDYGNSESCREYLKKIKAKVE